VSDLSPRQQAIAAIGHADRAATVLDKALN
jgi:hypothetical protein